MDRLWFGTLILLLGACAGKTDQTADQLDCDALLAVIDAAPAAFEGLGRSPYPTRFGETWEARVNAYGNRCVLVSSSETPRSYLCTATAPDQAVALASLGREVAGCLGSSWKPVARTAGGQAFAQEGSSILVEVLASDVAVSHASSVGLRVRRQ